MFNVLSSVKEVAARLDDKKSPKPWGGADVAGKNVDDLARIVKSTPAMLDNYQAYSRRFCTKVDPAIAAGFVQAAYPGDNTADLASKWGKVLDILNVDLYAECNDDVKAALDGVVGRLRYTRIEVGGPRLGDINEK